MGDITFDRLSPTKFEEFCHDLLNANGFVNIDWRKGTGLASSPADKGRDIVCELPRSDPDGSRHFERYFVDCKHYKKGVPPKELANLLAWAEAERPDVAVFAAAVADWRTAEETKQKIKKGSGGPKLALVENPDILATVAACKAKRPKLIVGFAAETDNVVVYAKDKRIRKGSDWILANDVSAETGIMGGDNNTVHLVTAAGVESWPSQSKDEVARALAPASAAAGRGRGRSPASCTASAPGSTPDRRPSRSRAACAVPIPRRLPASAARR